MAPANGWLARAARLLDERQLDCVVRGFLMIPAAIQQTYANPAEGHDAFSQAGDVAERFGDRDLAAVARMGRGRALIRLGEVVEGVGLLDEAMVAVLAGDVSPIFAGDIYCSVLQACQEIFDVRRAREWSASLTHWCASQPDLVPYRGECAIYRAEILQWEGAWPDALTEVQRACERLASAPPPATAEALYRRGELHRLRGEFAKAEESYLQAGQLGRAPQPGLALLRLAQGEMDAAVTAIRQLADNTPPTHIRARNLGAAVQIMLAAGDVAAARAAACELGEIALGFGTPALSAAAAHAAGAVQLAEGDAAAALDELRRAWTLWREVDAPYEEAQTRVLIARAADVLGDRETHDIERDAARQIFARLGAAPDLTRASEQRQPGSPGAAGGLSERELEVLRLMATGKTNRAIGEDLFISDKTVARHVSNIFNKLGLSSRAAATAYAYQHHLV